MNDANVIRATEGLCEYLKAWTREHGRNQRPLIVIAHDVRHFSRDFAELTARTAAERGCDAALFEGPRSTPQLSFAVRELGAQAGIVITASHNPPHDNGFKVYFEDGAQIVEPHASGIIERVNAARSGVGVSEAQKEEQKAHGAVMRLDASLDEKYLNRLKTLLLDEGMVRNSGLKIVFTPIHGTGGVISVPALKAAGLAVSVVPEQWEFDGRFPTVKSPNPENAEALALAVIQAEREDADVVIGTDPDCDRLGVAVKTRGNKMELLTGNQIASLIAYYRVTKFFEKGILHTGNASRAVIIKTVVTTDLLSAIAAKHGLRCVETLTGFKYIGNKLGKYEDSLPDELRADYPSQPEESTRGARLAHSQFYVFGGEESYGYSGSDFVRDKDGNGSALMFAETAAWAASRGLTVGELLDEIYARYGFYSEKNGSLTFEGAEGAGKIAKLAKSYGQSPPTEVDGAAVTGRIDFMLDAIVDADGDELPKEKMMQFRLDDGRRIAVRPSGTEPKIKFYMFAHRNPPEGAAFSSEDIAQFKAEAPANLERLWVWLQADVEKRLAEA